MQKSDNVTFIPFIMDPVLILACCNPNLAVAMELKSVNEDKYALQMEDKFFRLINSQDYFLFYFISPVAYQPVDQVALAMVAVDATTAKKINTKRSSRNKCSYRDQRGQVQNIN